RVRGRTQEQDAGAGAGRRSRTCRRPATCSCLLPTAYCLLPTAPIFSTLVLAGHKTRRPESRRQRANVHVRILRVGNRDARECESMQNCEDQRRLLTGEEVEPRKRTRVMIEALRS